MIERKIIDCEESGTLARTTMTPVAAGAAGQGIFVFTGKGKLPTRPHQGCVDFINKEGAKSLIYGKSFFKHASFAIPANKKYHMPITIYVGNAAVNELDEEIKSGKYDYFKNKLSFQGILDETISNEKARPLIGEYIASIINSMP